MKKTLFAVCIALIALSSHADNAQISVVYEPNLPSEGVHHLTRLKQPDALPEMLQFLNDNIPFAEPLTLRMGAKEGPLFDPQINEIWIPVEFLTEIDERFVQSTLATNAEQRNHAVKDVFLHTLLHEVAHAIIAQFEIPTLGKEEDAADNLANVLILEYFDDGDLIVLNAADMFALEDTDIDTFEKTDFWDEHSLDIQRYYSTVCHVYGALPDENEALIESGELTEEKADQCIDEYAQISADWLYVLQGLNEQ